MANLAVLVPAALSLGLASSGHCALMCGPLAACVVGPGGRGGVGYQSGRLAAYSLVGALAGGFGGGLPTSLAAHVSWLGAGLLVLSALGVVKPGNASGGRLVGGLLKRAASWGEGARGVAMGAATALLPCGVLASAVLVAMATTQAAHGALVMAVFAAGTMPLLVAGQLGWGALARSRWASRVPWLQRVAMGLGAVTLLYRGWALAQGTGCH